MNLVVISTCNAIDLFILREIEKRWPIARVFRPFWKGKPTPTSTAWRDRAIILSPRRWMGKLRSAVYAVADRREDQFIERQLFGSSPPTLRAPIEDLAASEFNTAETIERFRALKPDVLFVSGGPILREGILSLPTTAAVNLHCGIAPAYRGMHTVFWPLYRGDYDHIGVTLHHVSRGIDTGRILARGYPALEPSDTEATIWAKLAPVAAIIVCRFLEAVGKTDLSGRPQKEMGELFLAAGRKLRHDAVYRLRRFLGCRPPNRPERIESFFEIPQDTPVSVTEN